MGTDAKLLKDVTTKLLNLRLDHTEFTCLKALALFKPGRCFYFFSQFQCLCLTQCSENYFGNFNIVLKNVCNSILFS